MVTTIPKGRSTMDEMKGKRRRVKVSTQRQINIPKEFYDALGLDGEAFVEFRGKEIVIKPVDDNVVDFSAEILKDLLDKGTPQDKLLEEFTRIKSNIPKALDLMKEEAMKQPSITGSLDDYLDGLEDEGDDE